MSENIFEACRDDWMFPTTSAGRRAAGMCLFEEDTQDKLKAEPHAQMVMESTSATTRAKAMSAVLDWVDMGDHTYNGMDELIVAIADADGDDDISEDEEELYNEIWREIPDAFLSYGCSASDIQAFVDGPGSDADAAAARLGSYMDKEMDAVEADDENLITGFAYGEEAVLESASAPEDSALRGILEATYKRRKVVRDGQIIVQNKRISGKVRVSAAQKAALRKARRKANTAAARVSRRKSMRVRKSHGLK